MKAIERLYKYIDYKGYKPTNFEKEIGLSSGYLSIQKKRNADLGESVIVKINDYCQELSIEWLLTGEGSMLKDGENGAISQSIVGDNNKGSNQINHGNADFMRHVAEKDAIIKELLEQNKKLIDKLTS
jgi:hypothetical protein